MKYAGMFTELGYGENGSIIHHLDSAAPHGEIAAYLRAGVPYASNSKLVHDTLDPARPVAGTAELLTDGEWVWPAALAHFVERHGIGVGGEFEQHMAERKWQPPPAAAVARSLARERAAAQASVQIRSL